MGLYIWRAEHWLLLNLQIYRVGLRYIDISRQLDIISYTRPSTSHLHISSLDTNSRFEHQTPTQQPYNHHSSTNRHNVRLHTTLPPQNTILHNLQHHHKRALAHNCGSFTTRLHPGNRAPDSRAFDSHHERRIDVGSVCELAGGTRTLLRCFWDDFDICKFDQNLTV